MSDSGEDIFLTQNTFREIGHESESEVEFASSYLMGIGERTLDENEAYKPDMSDISDDDLVATCERFEKNHNLERFPVPVGDAEVQEKSRKRYVVVL